MRLPMNVWAVYSPYPRTTPVDVIGAYCEFPRRSAVPVVRAFLPMAMTLPLGRIPENGEDRNADL